MLVHVKSVLTPDEVAQCRARLESGDWVDGRVAVQEILELPAMRMHTVPGFDTAVFSYFSDIPFLPNWGTPLLLGAGSILVAHTKDEFVLKKDLETAVGLYVNLVRKLLNT